MKKIIAIVAILVIAAAVVAGVVVLNKGNNGNSGKKYNKEVQTCTMEKEKAKVTFEIAKDLGYEVKENSNEVELKHSENLSTIKARLYYDYPTSSNITKTEDSFYDDSYQDYKTETIGEYEGWSIYKRASLMTTYEINLKLTKQDESNKVYAADITVAQSPLEKGKAFNTEEFVNSEDFKHLVDSIKIELAEAQESAE